MGGFLAHFVEVLFAVLNLAVLARVLLSWLPSADNKITKFIYDITEPVLAPIRRVVPPIGGTLDLSPIIAWILLWALQSIVMFALAPYLRY
jgi:YggT family protein